MYTRDHEWYVRHLSEHVHMRPSDVVMVDSVAGWCREHGLEEKDEQRPLRLVPGTSTGAQMLINEAVPDDVLDERIRALRIRSQIKSVVYDRADLLNSDTKKIAFLFLKEYASAIPDLADDEFAMDEWVFEQMDQLGMFNP